MEKKDKEFTAGAWPGAESEEEYRALRGGLESIRKDKLGDYPWILPGPWPKGISTEEEYRREYMGLAGIENGVIEEYKRHPSISELNRLREEVKPVVDGGSVIWKAMTEALGREPTHGEHIRFLEGMLDAGWVNESFHVQKVRYLINKAKDEHNENLVLGGFIEDLKEMIVRMREKLVEQDLVLKKLAVVNSKGN